MPQYIQNPINKTAYKADTPFTRFDRSLTRFIEKHWTAYAKRRLVQAWARYNFQEIQKSALQHLRFWRQPRTSRKTKVILQRPPLRADTKNWNLDALETIFRLAQAYEFSVLIYNVPTPDVPTFAGEFPFDRRDLDNLNATIRSMADRYSAAHYTDLERLIPWSDWKDSIALGHRLDFSHFNGHGHEKLGNRVYNLIKGIR